MGYLCTQKGYKYHHPVSKKYLTSANVKFFEPIPFFYFTIICQSITYSSLYTFVIAKGWQSASTTTVTGVFSLSKKYLLHPPSLAVSSFHQLLLSNLDLPITLHYSPLKKGKCSSIVHTLSHFVSCDILLPFARLPFLCPMFS